MKFLRRNSSRHSKLGKKRKNKQKWRRPTGRHNKMREKKRGYSPIVSVGYKTSKKERTKLKEKNPVIVMNIIDLQKIGKGEIGIVGNIGKKKKLEIAKKAIEEKITLYNLNPKKFIKLNQKGKENGPK